MKKSTLTPSKRKGAALVMTSVCLLGILFLTAMALDSGSMMSSRREAQNVSDAASLAAAMELMKIQASGQTATLENLKDAAKLSATNNGYTDGTNCNIVVNWPPTSGTFASNTNSVEVKITFTYTNLVVNGSNSATVRSVASGDPSATAGFSMLLLEPSLSKSLWVNGGKLDIKNAATHVNSTNSQAVTVDGTSGSHAQGTVRTVGGSTGTVSPAPKTGYAPKNDPYALLPIPSTAGMTTRASNYVPVGGNITLNPGYYPNGLYCITGGNVTMNPGVYFIEKGNFWINTSGTVTANGVTIFYNGTSGGDTRQINFAGMVLCPNNGNYTFTPPTSGPYKGISFFQNPACTHQALYDFFGNSSTTSTPTANTGSIIVGTQYFPNNTVRCWSEEQGNIYCNELVAKNLKLQGSHEMYGTALNGGMSKLNWWADVSQRQGAKDVALVE